MPNPRQAIVVFVCVFIAATLLLFIASLRSNPPEIICQVSYSDQGWPAQTCTREP